MNIVDLQHFEERLRESEAKLGIRSDQGVPIVYERSGDTAGRLLASIIVVAIIVSLLSRNMNIKGPLSMEGMVSGQELVESFMSVIVCSLLILCFYCYFVCGLSIMFVLLFCLFVGCLLLVVYNCHFVYFMIFVICFVDLFVVW